MPVPPEDTGGRGRLSTVAAGVWLLVLVLLLHPLMKIMPMATENGSAAADLLRWKSLPVACNALENTLHA